LAGKEGLEKARKFVLWNAYAGILNNQLQHTFAPVASGLRGARGDDRSGNSDLPVMPNGIEGIQAQIQKGLFELVCVSMDNIACGQIAALEANVAGPQLRFDQSER